MDRWFFIEVRLSNRAVNTMGCELRKYVYDKYDQVVVHENCLLRISNDIKDKMSELEEKYTWCKNFKFEISKYLDCYKETVTEISVRTNNPYHDNYLFVLSTKYVRKMNLETSLNI